MAEETEKELLITLDFSGTKKKFTNIDELREFMQSQRDAWSWLEQAAREDDNLAQVWDPFKRYFTQADQFIELLEWHPDDQKKQTELTKVFREQTQTAVDQGFTLADAPNALFVLDLKDKKSPQVAGYALASLNKEKISLFSPDAYEGAYWAMKYLQGSAADSIEAQRKVQDSVQQRWSDRFEKQHEDLEEKNEHQIRETTELQERTVSLMKNVEKQATLRASEFERQVNEQISDFENRIANQGKIFREQAAELQEQSDLVTKGADELANRQAIIIKQRMAKHENVLRHHIDNQGKRLKERATELQEQSRLLSKRAEEQITSQATIFDQQMDNQEKIFIDRTADMQERFDLLSKKAGEQVNSQAVIFDQQMDNQEKTFIDRTTVIQERFDLLSKKAGEQVNSQAIIFDQQVDNQEKTFIDRTTDMQERFDSLTKRAEEQTTSQAITFRQQVGKHENVFKHQTTRQEITHRQQGTKHENISKNQRYNRVKEFKEQTTKRTTIFRQQLLKHENIFKYQIAPLVKKFDKLHKETEKNFSAFSKFLKLSASYHEATKFWLDKQKIHIGERKNERVAAVTIALLTAIIFTVTAVYLFHPKANFKSDFLSIISTINMIMPSAEAADSPTLCDALTCDPVVCSPVPGAPALCGAGTAGSLACNLVPCSSADCKAVDCKAVDCKAVDCKAVDCKAVPCEVTSKKIAANSTTATSPTVNAANVTINSYIDNQRKISMLQKTATTPTRSEPNGNKNGQVDDLWKVSILLMISTLGFWLTRVSARGFVSNQHLEMDCRERITILFTYFALQDSDSPLRSNERPIVLETMFRPGTTGLIKDDGPANILETLIKATKRR